MITCPYTAKTKFEKLEDHGCWGFHLIIICYKVLQNHLNEMVLKINKEMETTFSTLI